MPTDSELCELEELIRAAVSYTVQPTRIEKLVMLNHLTPLQEWVDRMKTKNEGL